MDLADTIARGKLLTARKDKIEEQLGSVLAEIAECNAVLIAAGEKIKVADEKGTLRAALEADTGTAKITWPVAALKLTEENQTEAKVIAGAAWGKIAEKVPVTHTLVKAARDLIPALLPKAAAQKLLDLLAAKPGAPRVVFS